MSPMRVGQNWMESPQKLSTIKATLAIRQETVEKELDSILGDSPSPSKQVSRGGYHLISPEKFCLAASPVKKSQFTLKLDRVDAIAEGSPENASDEEMSSHDLTAEEEAKGLRTFAEIDAEGALASQRDRMAGLENSISSAEKTCDEIRMSFAFSPTKLQEYLVKKPANEAVERFHDKIEKHERELKTA